MVRLPPSAATALLLLGYAPALPGQDGATDPIPAHESFTLASKAVAEARTINVYTPPGYSPARGGRFPVLYMPDGGLDEDFPHVVKTLDSLVRLGRVRPFLVVGIPNTERRRDMTGPTTIGTDSAIAKHVGGSAQFRAFIRDELMPEIRRRYRTTGETGIIGESLAGLFIIETFLQEPGLFRHYIALSPSLWWNRDALVTSAPELLRGFGRGEHTLFLAAANEPGIAPQADTLAHTIRATTLRRLTFWYEPRPDLEHSTIYRALGPEALVKVLGR
jgi:predicted alpha/beta superfamily hydrolase